MSEQKVNAKRTAIALGILCIALSVALAFMVNEAYRLRNIAELRESQIWLDHHQVTFESNGETDFDYQASYAGYVTVQFESASHSMYVEVSYDWAHPSSGLIYSRRANLTTSGNFTFPVLPASVRIAIGNLADSHASARITATYFY